MDKYGWSVREIEELLCCKEGSIQNLLDGQPLHEELAEELAFFFGTTPEYWMNLERAYRDWIDFQETTS